MIKRLKNLIRTEPRDCMNLTVKKPKVTAGSRHPNRRTIFKDREDEGVVTAKQHRGVSIHSIYHPQDTNSRRDSRHNTTHMTLKGELAVKPYTKNVKARVGQYGHIRQAQVTMGRVDSPGSADHQGFALLWVQ